MTMPETFGQWVREQRKQRSLTQKALGKLTGYAEVTVRQIERDTYKLTRFVVERFVNCLAVDSAEQERITRFALKQLPANAITLQSAQGYRSGTPFIGRESELAYIAELLRNPECRCISIVGVGGVGKTRLAVRAFAAYTRESDREAWFVPLTEITSTEAMARAIAAVMGISLNPFSSPPEQLLLTLQTRQMLLVLDNFEQLLPESIEFLKAIAERAPAIQLIVTSRERLQIISEWSLRLQGLGMSDEAPLADAMSLFINTALRRNEHFIPLEIEAIREICRLLQGIPLAIEMAASWTDVYTCVEIQNSVSNNALDLTSRYRDVDERHKSLQAVFETTWERLSSHEQAALKRLAIFRGGFTRAAAQQIAGTNGAELIFLQDKMLVISHANNRLVLHEMIRQLALQKLMLDEQELREARISHAEYFLQLLPQIANRIKYNDARSAIGQLNLEQENVHLAWETMLKERRPDWFNLGWEGLWLFFNVTSRFGEGEILFASATDAFNVADVEREEKQVSRFSNVLVGIFMMRQGRVPEALALFSAPGMETLGVNSNPMYRYIYYFTYSYVLHAAGDGQAALANAEIGLQHLKFMEGDFYWHVTSYFQVGRVHHLLGNSDAAYDYISYTLQLFREHKIGWGVGLTLTELGFVAETKGQINEALTYYEAVLAAVTEWEEVWNYHRTQISIGRVKLTLGRLEEAVAIFCSTLQDLQKNPQLGLEIDCFVECALALKHYGDIAFAQVLLIYCSTHPECFQPVRTRAATYLTTLQAAYPDVDLAPAQHLFPSAKQNVAIKLLDHLNRARENRSEK